MTSSLAYWIESPTGKTWLKVPEMLPFETRIFYATKTPGYAPDGDAVFDAFDDFDNLSAWGTVAGTAFPSVTSESSYTGTTSVKMQTGALMECAKRTDIKLDNAAYEIMLYIPSATVGSQAVIATDYNGSIAAVVGINYLKSTTKFVYRFGTAWYVSNISVTAGWHKLTVAYNGTQVQLKINDIVVGERAYTSGTSGVSFGDFWTNNNSQVLYFDTFTVRKCIVSEPTVTAEDHGAFCKISVTNNSASTLTDYQVAVNSTDLGVSTVNDSILIVPADITGASATVTLTPAVFISSDDSISASVTLSLASSASHISVLSPVSSSISLAGSVSTADSAELAVSCSISLSAISTETHFISLASALSLAGSVAFANETMNGGRATMQLASTFDRMRSFGDISALASESVDISKSVNDTMWVLTTTVRGGSPVEFFHYSYETKDHIGTDQVIFTGFTPDTVNRHTALQNQSDVVMYDYGWYLSAQYLPDDALVINLGGNRTTWAEWIKYLLEGTGITPYMIASSTADDKEFNFTAKTTKRDAIDAISKYCGFIFVVGWNTSTPPEPIAYWIDQEDIDDPSNGLDLPAPVTITWPDPHLVEIPSVQGTPEEKINRVRIRGNDTSGNWYSATMQTPALTHGEEIAREYYEESSAWNSQAKVNARALALYNYFTTTTYTVEAKFLKRMDLRLYQKIRFQGSGFPSKLTSLGWLRIIGIHYHISGIEKYVTIKAVTDKGQLSLLLERMNYAAGGTISDIDTIVSNRISAIPMTEVGTVLSISGDIATVQTESGKIVQARIIS